MDPNTLGNTQKVESSWRSMRKALTEGGTKRECLVEYLGEYLWRRHYKHSKSDMFLQFLKDISNLCNKF